MQKEGKKIKMKKTIMIISGIVVIAIILMVLIMFVFQEPKIAVLGYHAFATTQAKQNELKEDNLSMDIGYFEEQLKYLQDHHYKTVTLEEFYRYLQGEEKLPRKSVLITMDDGYMSNYDLAFPLLQKYQMNAVVFVIGGNVESSYEGYMDFDTIKKAQSEYPNITFASHSYALHEQGAIDRGIEYIREDFKKMENVLETKYFAYPYGNYNEEAIQVLKENGYQLAFGFGPGKEHRKATKQEDNYKIPRLNISNDMPFWKFKLRLQLPF